MELNVWRNKNGVQRCRVNEEEPKISKMRTSQLLISDGTIRREIISNMSENSVGRKWASPEPGDL